MAEIDLLEFQDDLRKNRLSRVLKSREFLSHYLIISTQIPTLINPSFSILDVFAPFVIATQFHSIKQDIKRAALFDEQELIKVIRNSENYQTCLSEYQTYISEIAKLIRCLGFTTVKETLIYLELLLNHGFFSKNMHHQYKNFKYQNDYVVELCGARVLSGESVCRHMTAFFCDILKELEHTSCLLSVKTTSNPLDIVNKRDIKWDHCVLGVTEKGEKMLFDPTNGAFMGTPDSLEITKKTKRTIAQMVGTRDHFTIINNNQAFLNEAHQASLPIITKSPLMTISQEELEYLSTRINQVFEGNMWNQMSFYQFQERRKQEIIKLQKRLFPYSDDPIKEWTIN